MNNLTIEVKQWSSTKTSTQGVNDFISECTEKGMEVLDITSHVTEIDDYMTYIFIFKLKTIEN